MGWLSQLFLALAVSLDSLGIGFVFGTNKMELPTVAVLIVSGISASGISLGMVAGNKLSVLLKSRCGYLGGLLLICMSLFSACLTVKNNRATCGAMPRSKSGLCLPGPTDTVIDKRSVSYGESVLLGLLLAIDSVGAGFGVALNGVYLLATSILVLCFTILSLAGGYWIGLRVVVPVDPWLLDFAPSVLLLLLGIRQLI